MKCFKQSLKGILLGACFFLLYSTTGFSVALEVSTIPTAQSSTPPCSSGASYFEMQPPMAQTGPYSAANCQSSCQMAAQQEPQKANAILAQAKAQDAQINATNAAGSNALQAATANNQLDPQQKVNNLNSLGNNSAAQQAQLASAVSQAMKQCAQNIRSKCQSGVDQQDTKIGEQAAKSCEDAGKVADQVNADKMAKAGEMGQNGQQAAQNGQGMGMPQIPQGGGAGNQPVNSDLAKGSAINKSAEGNSNLQVGQTPGIKLGDAEAGHNSSITPGAFNTNGSAGGDRHIGSRSPTAENSSGSTSGKGLGVSSGSSSAATNSSGQSAMGAASNEKDKDRLNGLEAKAGDESVAPAAGGVKPAFLGLNNNNVNPTELLGLIANGENAATGTSTAASKNGKLAAAANGLFQSDPRDPMLDLTLFSRIKTKLTAVSKQMHMQ